MRISYPLGWSRPGRQADREQTVATAASLARAGAEVTLLAPRGWGDPPLGADELRDYFHVEGGFRLEQRPFAWPDSGVAPSYLWLRQAMGDPLVQTSDFALTRLPVVVGPGSRRRHRFVFDHYKRWPDELPFFKPRFRRVLGSEACLGVIAHSDYAADSYRNLPLPPEKLLVAHNGFDLSAMTPALSRQEARRRLDLPPGRSIAVYAGRLNRRKGLDAVLSMASLRPTVLFVLVGSEGDGPVEQAARSLANVQVVPWQTPQDLPAWLYAADVLLIPPSLEPLRLGTCILPLKTFSYLAAGRPILAPRAPDTAELLEDGRTALLTPGGDTAAAVEALDRLLSDPGLSESLGRNSTALAQARTWDERARRLLEFFERRLSGVGSDRPVAA